MAITEARHQKAPLLPAAPPAAQTTGATTGTDPARYVWAAARVAVGWVFLWAFLDKLFGWGFATPAAKAWINGGSPTTGFLKALTRAGETFGLGGRWAATPLVRRFPILR
ncbi:hypothetical protein [Microbispora triticiradicis]|uniref:hypothetical protein n=1 Tax=Microbispora triticiradicis TaxID=2200763 RepID=UPI00269972BD|nr:hypothetical protein [Microbispora triticiradicis]